MTHALNVATIRWPFWCLALAWLCANIPGSTRLDLGARLDGFLNFSHQSELAEQTRALLHSKPVTSEPALGQNAASPANSKVPLLPASDGIKKLDLSNVPPGLELAFPISEPHSYLLPPDLPPERLRAPPPLPPPKFFWVS